MAKPFIRTLPDGTRRGNTRGLRECERAGWQILTPGRHKARYAPRTANDCRPWTDGIDRHWARDCWAVPRHRIVSK
ncbi:hypothetical protein ACFRMQ_19420 [Kitasatospora sp. NPDC056783]|uniref:hypothetical protein n=1 Tax=Kitasatospora sp. NPDC056783 TaxID=3345943 RepID=UPI0036A7EE70